MVSPDFPDLPQVPDGASIMEQFRIMLGGVAKALETGRVKATGIISMVRPDGTQMAPNGYTGDGAVNLPWGLNVDGNDDVWFGSTWNHAVVYMAGDKTAGHPPGIKTGDVLHVFHNGTIQVGIDSSIDAAGDVWITNNWNDLATDFGVNHNPAQSTWGGGTGVTVIYGVAEPVKPPKMGAVRRY